MVITIAGFLFLGSIAALLLMGIFNWSNKFMDRYSHDPQLAAGEWKIEIQTPPCDTKNLRVIWPKQSGYPATIECSNMEVGEK